MARRSDVPHDLPVLGDVDGRSSVNREERFTSSRQSNVSGRFPPGTPGPLSSRRTPTPSKQISLQSVRRREEGQESFDDVDLAELNSSLKLESERSFLERENSQTSLGGFRTESPKFTVKLPISQQKESATGDRSHGDVPTEKANDKEKSGSSDDDDDDDEDDEDEDVKKEDSKAPNQLLLEFLDCLMKGEFQTAAKLCEMILMYEPHNKEALTFQPLIQQRLIINEAESGSDESGSDDDDEDDDDDSDDDDDDDSGGDSDNSDDVSSDNDEERGDSGISSAHSNCNSD